MIPIFFILTFTIISSLHYSSGVEPPSIPIGIISGTNYDSRETSSKFWSFGNRSFVKFALTPLEEQNVNFDSLPLTRAFCRLLKTGVQALVSDSSPELLAYTSRFGLPFLTFSEPVLQSANETKNPNFVTLLPNPSAGLGDLLKHYRWESFMFIYDSDNGPAILQNILEVTNHQVYANSIFRVRTGDEVHHIFKKGEAGRINYKILMATSEEILRGTIALFSRAPSSTLQSNFHFIIASSDFQGEPYRGKRGNFLITKLSLIDTSRPGFSDLINRWQTLPGRRSSDSVEMTSSAVMMRDIVEVIQNSISRLATQYIPETRRGLDCLSDVRQQAHNSILVDSIKKTVLLSGLTGNVRFSSAGVREGYDFNVLEIRPVSKKTVGSWSVSTGLLVSESSSSADDDENQKDSPNAESQKRVSWTVVSILTKPFLFYKNESNSNDDSSTGNERYQGFIKDFLDYLFQILDMDYKLHIVRDGYYGFKKNGVWNGMVGEIMRGEAQMAVAPLTMLSERQEVVEFSTPFLRFGLNIVMKKPKEPEISKIGPLFFLKVWSYEVWLLLIFVWVCFGFLTYGFSHYLGEPDRVRSLDTKISDRLSLCSSFWFVLGGLTQRSTGIYPRTIANRVLTVVWGIFCLSVFVMYTASVIFAVLRYRTAGIATTTYSKSSIDVLQSFMDNGYPKIGMIPGGTTWSFFTNSTMGLYKDYGKYLLDHPEILTKNSKAGVERIRTSAEDYAVIFESPISQHVVNTEPCDLMVTSGYLEYRAYGVVFPLDDLVVSSEMKADIDRAVLNLTQEGTLRMLYEKWWHHQSKCEDPYLNIISSLYSNSLTLHEVSGLFYFLLMFIILAVALASFEYYSRFKRLSTQS